MKITVSEALKNHLMHRNKRNIVVEVATTDRSDFDVTEIFIRLCDYSHRDYLKEKKADFCFVGMNDYVYSTLEKIGFQEQVGKKYFYKNLEEYVGSMTKA